MVKPAIFAHVVYQTWRFDEMIAWYCEVFEAEVVYENPAFAVLTCGDHHHQFAFVDADISRLGDRLREDKGESGVSHIAYTYANVADVMDGYARLKRSGIIPYWPVHYGTTLSFHYRDPDGNRIEFQVLTRTPAPVRSRVGVLCDPDTLLARFETGELEDALLALPGAIWSLKHSQRRRRPAGI